MVFPFKKKSLTLIKGLHIVENSKFKDSRGSLHTLFDSFLEKKIIKKRFSNYSDKIIIRKKNTLTGIHGDGKTWKIIKCLKGKILVVLVNCKRESKNFKKNFRIILSENDTKSLIIPPNIGNSYLCIGKTNLIYYKFLYNGSYNDQKKQFTYKWNDKRFKINWPIRKPILSNRDK
tara:strand:+ start:467 stop:991 length:525 start_codon:yes stop_codon:yes gene_type:complete